MFAEPVLGHCWTRRHGGVEFVRRLHDAVTVNIPHFEFLVLLLKCFVSSDNQIKKLHF